jgi:hypothetical protein
MLNEEKRWGYDLLHWKAHIFKMYYLLFHMPHESWYSIVADSSADNLYCWKAKHSANTTYLKLYFSESSNIEGFVDSGA